MMMKRMLGLFVAFGTLALAAGPAGAEETTTPPTGAAQTQTETAQPAPTPPPSESAPAAPAGDAAPASPAPVTPAAAESSAPAGTDPLAAIRAGGKNVNVKADKNATTALDAASADVEKIVASDGDRKIAERLAAEFGTTPDALLAEKGELKTSWGQLMIAHSLAANAAASVSPKQLIELRGEGMSWGAIATGMGLHLGQVVRATKEEVRVAKGLAKPDGKVAVVTGTGSKAGAAKAEESAMKAAAKAEKEAKAQAAKEEAAKAEAASEAAKAEAAKSESAKEEAAKDGAVKDDAAKTPGSQGEGAAAGKK